MARNLGDSLDESIGTIIKSYSALGDEDSSLDVMLDVMTLESTI